MLQDWDVAMIPWLRFTEAFSACVLGSFPASKYSLVSFMLGLPVGKYVQRKYNSAKS